MYKLISGVKAVLMGSKPTPLQRNFDKKCCQICSHRDIDNASHIILKCNTLSTVRVKHFQTLSDSMPHAMLTCYQTMTDDEKLAFILSPLQCGFTYEWLNVYGAIANAVFGLYTARANAYDALLGRE